MTHGMRQLCMFRFKKCSGDFTIKEKTKTKKTTLQNLGFYLLRVDFVVVVLRISRKRAGLEALKRASGARSGPRAGREVRPNRLVLT